jgi:hypothetical protein
MTPARLTSFLTEEQTSHLSFFYMKIRLHKIRNRIYETHYLVMPDKGMGVSNIFGEANEGTNRSKAPGLL